MVRMRRFNERRGDDAVRTGLSIPAISPRSWREAIESSCADGDEAIITGLTGVEIGQMTDGELARVIRAARLPLLSLGVDLHLELYDRQTLERLAYLARRCCQNRTFC